MRFLLARPDHLGDVLLTLPAASALKRAFPRSTVTYLVAPGSADAPALSADVDDALTVEFPAPNDGRPPPVEVVDREARRLRGSFDAAVILRPDDAWSAAIAAAAGVPVRVGFACRATERLLTRSFDEPSGTHAVSLAWMLVREAARELRVDIPMLEQRGVVAIRERAEGDVDAIIGRAA